MMVASRLALALCTLALCLAGGAASASTLQSSPLVTSKIQGDHTHWTVQWKNNKGYPDSIVAQCGDTVTFEWDGFTHNVGVSVDGGCDSILSLTPPAKSGKHTFALNDTVSSDQPFDILADSGVWGQHANKWRSGKVWFACDVGSHCSKGKMLIGFVIKGDCANFTSNFTSSFTSYHSSSTSSSTSTSSTSSSSSSSDLDLTTTKNGSAILSRNGKVVHGSGLPASIAVVNGERCFGCGSSEEAAKSLAKAAKTLAKAKDRLEQSQDTINQDVSFSGPLIEP